MARKITMTGAAAAAVGLVAAAAVATSRRLAPGLPLDDAWIHAAFARNLALDRTWGLLAGEPSGGESSLLWPVLLAAGEVGGAALAPLVAVLLGAGSFLLLPGLAGRLASTAARGLAVAAAVGLCGPLLFASLSGMETVPALTAGLAALVLLDRGCAGRAAACAGLAVLLRPDAGLLVVVMAGSAAALPAGRAAAARRLWPAFALGLFTIAMLSLLEHHFPPATLGGRRWIAGLPPQVDPLQAPAGLRLLGREWAAALAADLGAGRAFTGLPGAAVWRAAWGVAALAAVGRGAVLLVARRQGRGPTPARLLLAWTLLVLLFYAVVLPDRGHAGRYQAPVYIAAILLAVEGLGDLLRGRRRSAVPAAGAAAVLIVGLVANLVETPRLWATAVDHINRLHVRAARDLPLRVGPDARVAVFDVGAAAYARPCPLVDISGLSGPTTLEALQERAVAGFLHQRRATHLLLPCWTAAEGAGSLRDRLGLLGAGAPQLTVTDTWSYAGAGWWRQFLFTGNAFRHLRLYAVAAPADPRASGSPH